MIDPRDPREYTAAMMDLEIIEAAYYQGEVRDVAAAGDALPRLRLYLEALGHAAGPEEGDDGR